MIDDSKPSRPRRPTRTLREELLNERFGAPVRTDRPRESATVIRRRKRYLQRLPYTKGEPT